MVLIKEWCKKAKTCVISTKTYASGLDHFLMLFEEAKKDFGFLKPHDITIKQYGGDRRKGFFGIEFGMGSAVPESYDRIGSLELTR